MNKDDQNGFGDWGGYMNAKIQKLDEQFTKASNIVRQSNLFNGISVFVNGYTDPPADEIKRIIMLHGGTFHNYQLPSTTYVIASNLPDTKIRNMNTEKIINPQWILQCIKHEKIIDYTNYLLYTNYKRSQPKISFEKHSTVEKKNELSIVKDLNRLNTKLKRNPKAKFEKTNTIKKTLENKNIKMENEKSFQEIPNEKSNVRTRSAVDPSFLTDFYNNSRLHHIATLGSLFKQHILDLRDQNIKKFPDREILRTELSSKEPFQTLKNVIMHIDMDCFFVSVGLRTRPHLIGLPVAVTHSKGNLPKPRLGVDRQTESELYMERIKEKYPNNDNMKRDLSGTNSLSEIACCSYEARDFGIKNGMFVGEALKLCPTLKTIPYDFDAYKEVASSLYNIICKYTLNIEAVSCDEMFVDLTDLLNDIKCEINTLVKYIRQEIKATTGCPCSAGVGQNKIQARMSTKQAKPDGQFILDSTNVVEYFSKIPCNSLPGVGYSTSFILEKKGWNTCGDLQNISLHLLQEEFGKKIGENLFNFCRGTDNRQLNYDQIRKSVSAEVNYGIRFTTDEQLTTFLKQLCQEVQTRLKNIKRKGKCITLKLMIRSKNAPKEASKFMGHGICDYITKSVSLSQYTDNYQIILKTILSIIKDLNIPPEELRGIGVQITKLDDKILKNLQTENSIKNIFLNLSKKPKASPISTNHKNETDLPKCTIDNANIIQDKQKTLQQKKPQVPKNKVNNKNIDIANMMLNPTHQKNTSKVSAEIDYDVLAELPQEMQLEILRDLKFQNFSCNTKNESINKETTQKTIDNQNEMENSAETTMNYFFESNTDKKIKHYTSYNNLFENPSFRELILSWVSITKNPVDYDINIIIEHAIEQIEGKKINKIFVPLRYFYRKIKESKNCAWHHAYKNIFEAIQSKMLYIYGGKLLLTETFNCEICKL